MNRDPAGGIVTLELPLVGRGSASNAGPSNRTVGGQRELFLDALRPIALVRVMFWHVFGMAAITYVAAMPVMFFVTGSLLAKSLDRRRARHGVGRRVALVTPLVPAHADLAPARVALLLRAVRARRGLALLLPLVAVFVLDGLARHGPMDRSTAWCGRRATSSCTRSSSWWVSSTATVPSEPSPGGAGSPWRSWRPSLLRPGD